MLHSCIFDRVIRGVAPVLLFGCFALSPARADRLNQPFQQDHASYSDPASTAIRISSPVLAYAQPELPAFHAEQNQHLSAAFAATEFSGASGLRLDSFEASRIYIEPIRLTEASDFTTQNHFLFERVALSPDCAVPEPLTYGFVAVGLIALGLGTRRRKRR